MNYSSLPIKLSLDCIKVFSVYCIERNIIVHKRCKTQILLLKIIKNKPYAQTRKNPPLFFHPVRRISEVISLFHTIKSEKGGG